MLYGMNRPVPEAPTPPDPSGVLNTPSLQHSTTPPPAIPDHELLRRIGGGSYGEVWLARNKLDFRCTTRAGRPGHYFLAVAPPRCVYSWFRFAAQMPASAPDKCPSHEIGPACGSTP